MIFIAETLIRILGEVDTHPGNGTQVFEVSLGGVLLFIRKAENFGTMGNQMVNKGSSEETSKLTLGVFLLKTRGS
jgi:hypothetical protein